MAQPNATPQPDANEEYRRFGLTDFALDNSTTIFLVVAIILVGGVLSYLAMPKEQFPEVTFPQVFVNTPYPGNSAADVENLVTRPIEKELKGIDGVKQGGITSTSAQDISFISIEFETDIDIEDAKQDVKDAVDKAKSELPDDLPTDPIVQDINLAEVPVVTVNLAGQFTADQLRDYGEYLQDEIETIDGVTEVQLKGVQDREVRVDVDLYEMESRQVSFRDIAQAIQTENLTLSGGEVTSNGFKRAVRVVGQFERVQEVEDIVVKAENQNSIYLRDIADVSFAFEDRTSYARADGQPVVSLDVVKRSGANLLATIAETRKMVEEAQATGAIPENLNVTFFNDQSVQTKAGVDNLLNSIISGVILVVLVLLFFLGTRNASFVGAAIPLSMLMGIGILYALGVTLNTVVLFALVLALGLLVDNGIVVVENIYRYMQEGYSAAEASRRGAGEVAVPIIASTATTLAAFIPLAFWPGIIGSFMQYLPITLIIVLSSSLFVALVINPVLTRYFMKVDEKLTDPKVRRRKQRNILLGSGIVLGVAGLFYLAGVQWMGNLLVIAAALTVLNFFVLRPGSFAFQERVLPPLERGYDKFVRWALKAPALVIGGAIGLLVLSVMLLGANPPKVEFFPEADPVYVNAFVELPMGTDIEVTNDLVADLEKTIRETIEPYGQAVDATLTQIGENTADPAAPPEPGATPHKARLTVSFVPYEDRGDISSRTVMNEIREAVGAQPGVQIIVDKNQDGPPTGKPINLEIVGEEINELLTVSQDVIQYMNGLGIKGIEELKADVKLGKPELTVNVDREAARRYGISTYDIAMAIRTAQYGDDVSDFKQGEDEYPIYIRLKDEYQDVAGLLQQKITFRNPANGRISQVPIESVASVDYGSTYSSIRRKDLDRMVTISSNVLDGANANEIVEELKVALEDYNFPQGITYEFTGEQEEQAENSAFLGRAFSVALAMIFLILVLQFNSISDPIIILIAVGFSTVGVLLGYALTGMNIVIIMTGVGVISLAGVVVNNAIVLIDYIKLLIEERREALGLDPDVRLPADVIKEAIVVGGSTRLRPVLLTAITTILGLVPLAVGFNIDFFSFVATWDPNVTIGGDNVAFWGPMAWTVIYGLVFATFLTLVVVPVLFWLVYQFTQFLKRVTGMERDAVDVTPEQVERKVG